MPALSLESSVFYAKSLLPETLIRSVSSVQTTISRSMRPPPQPRCFAVCSHNRRSTAGLEGPSLDQLLDQAARVFLVPSQDLTLVLEEDGTVVDCHAFFQSLPNHTVLMVLQRGQVWTENKICPSSRKPLRTGIARLTFDLYKLHPKEFLGCLSVRGTLYDMPTFSYDLSCSRAKPLIQGSMRLLTYSVRLAGQLLLLGASSALHVLGEEKDHGDGDYADGSR
ncbi:hypothetical protein NHX12_021480 [Muraenolepis orangiensis]|uniref:CIDE-N domain-containing protein n=1 Tax=Muraenolepis orangiensis TaxID=630683 RepID=A0A9Q0ETP9_9TELE|nr:hypothetical protein NHX12_021480 [Muraenolepis orangiensis]